MRTIKAPGTCVFYTGDISHAVDGITRNLMIRCLTEGYWYKVVYISDDGPYRDHYYLEGSLYPYKSFTTNPVEYYGYKYNLR